MDVLSPELWSEIKLMFLGEWPKEAIVAIWPDGSWKKCENAHPDPTKSFTFTHKDNALLLGKRPALFLHIVPVFRKTRSSPIHPSGRQGKSD